MPILTDRQRLELALPACLLFTFSGLPGVFIPADPAAIERAEADIVEMRANLRAASLEPFSDLIPRKRQAAVRRLERLVKSVILDWKGQPMLSLALTLWYFLKDLTDREVLLLWEGSAMDRAMERLMPMCAHGFDEQHLEAAAADQARRLLARLQAEGLYL